MKWIKYSDRLPEQIGDYLCAGEKIEMSMQGRAEYLIIAHFNGENFYSEQILEWLNEVDIKGNLQDFGICWQRLNEWIDINILYWMEWPELPRELI